MYRRCGNCGNWIKRNISIMTTGSGFNAKQQLFCRDCKEDMIKSGWNIKAEIEENHYKLGITFNLFKCRYYTQYKIS